MLLYVIAGLFIAVSWVLSSIGAYIVTRATINNNASTLQICGRTAILAFVIIGVELIIYLLTAR